MRPILLACAPDEWHEGSLLVLGALLRRQRWPVANLGQAVPLDDLGSVIEDLNPPLVIVVAMTPETATGLAHWPDVLPGIAQTGKPVIGYGGRVFTQQPKWRTRVAGHFLGDTYSEGLANIERLLPQGI